jgi:hypothetical protein
MIFPKMYLKITERATLVVLNVLSLTTFCNNLGVTVSEETKAGETTIGTAGIFMAKLTILNET